MPFFHFTKLKLMVIKCQKRLMHISYNQTVCAAAPGLGNIFTQFGF